MIWRGAETIPGAPEAIARLRATGAPIAFVTNSAARTPAQVAAKLATHGIPDAESLVITAAMAAASMVEPGQRVLAVGSEGLRHALLDRGAVVLDAAEIGDDNADGDGAADDVAVDVVALGITTDFDYAMLTRAMRAIRGGARFVATNDDATFPDANGLLPGNGALVAALATCAEQSPEIAGKPHAPIARFVRERLGETGVMVGDRPETDGRFAASLGYDFALVLSGVVSVGDLPVSPEPRYVAADILAMVRDFPGGDTGSPA